MNKEDKVKKAQRLAKKIGHCLCDLRLKCPCDNYIKNGKCPCSLVIKDDEEEKDN